MAESTSKIRILVADDDVIVRKLLARILRSESNYEMRNAENGQEVWEAFQSGYEPDLVLLDIDMPRMTGLELLEKMRSSEAYKRIPILMVTSRDDMESKATAAAWQVYAYMVKPFNPQRVLGLIKEALTSSGKVFEPTGFEGREMVLERENMSGPVYFKLMVGFVEMLGIRLDEIERNISACDSKALEGTLLPLRKMAKRLGAYQFETEFNEISEALKDGSHEAHEAARRKFRHTRSDINELKDNLEAYLNVVIYSDSAQKIMTKPDMLDWESESIRLSAEIVESSDNRENGFSMGNQQIILRAFQGEDRLVTARLSVENGRIVLKSDDGRQMTQEIDLARIPGKSEIHAN